MPRISQETIERVAAANDIVEVIQSRIPLKRAGSAYKALCPFHQEKTPSFTVNPQRQSFHCFGCGKGGTVFTFLMEYENLAFIDAVRHLAERANIPVLEDAAGPEADARLALRKRLLALHAGATEWFHEGLLRGAEAAPAREYLKSRGITREVAARWKLGYAPDSWDAFSSWALTQKYRRDELLQSGLVISREGEDGFYDRFRGRLMFPIHNDRGEVVAFSGRVLKADAPGGKYVNSPETPLFTKGEVLFGLDKTKREILKADCAVVCEGQLDLITAFEAGIGNVIAPQGTAFTPKQAHLLRRHAASVILCFDADAAGQQAAERSFGALFAEGLIVRVAEMPPGQDPDSLIRSEGSAAFRERLTAAKDFFDHLIDLRGREEDLSSHAGKLNFARTLAVPAGLVGDPFLRDSIIDRVNARLGIGGDHFRRLVARQMAGPVSGNRRPGPGDPPAAKRKARPSLAICQLAISALTSAEALEFLHEQEWDTLLSEAPDSLILQRILQGDFDPAAPASVTAFLSTLEAGEQNLLNDLMRGDIPANAASVADCWNTLRRRVLEARRDSLATRLKQPGLPMAEILGIQKEILDLQKQLADITRLADPRT